MNPNLELLVTIVINAVADMTKEKAVELLEGVKEKAGNDIYKAALHLANAGVKKLNELAAGTETKIDDQLVAKVSDIVKTSAQKNGVVLD